MPARPAAVPSLIATAPVRVTDDAELFDSAPVVPSSTSTRGGPTVPRSYTGGVRRVLLVARWSVLICLKWPTAMV